MYNLNMKIRLFILSLLILLTLACSPPVDEVCYLEKEDISGAVYEFAVSCDPVVIREETLNKITPFICSGINNCFFGVRGRG